MNLSRYSKATRAFLSEFGWAHVTHLTVVRTPISERINSLLGLVTLGHYEKAKALAGYDLMFHLAIVIETDEGHRFMLEKNATIRLGKVEGLTPQTERFVVPMGDKTPSLGQLMYKAEKWQGSDNWFRYNAFNAGVGGNCQAMVAAVLNGNKVASHRANAFVNQDALAVLKHLPAYTSRVANALTDLAALFPHGAPDPPESVERPRDLLYVGLEKRHFSLREAHSFLSDHHYKVTTPRETPEHWLFPQQTPYLLNTLGGTTTRAPIPHGFLVMAAL